MAGRSLTKLLNLLNQKYIQTLIRAYNKLIWLGSCMRVCLGLANIRVVISGFC